MSQDLMNKYRPRYFSDVVGHEAIVAILEKAIEDKNLHHSILFSGQPGTGKTTLARIIAKTYGLHNQLLEIDGANYAKVEQIRELVETIKIPSLFNGKKFYIVDECQALSAQAWQALLKVVEEPPEHVYFIFCTTEENKIPKTIKTRCLTINLKNLADYKIFNILLRVVEGEGFDFSDKELEIISKESQGIPRLAINNLIKCVALEEDQELQEVLETIVESPKAIELCRYLIKMDSCKFEYFIEAKRIASNIETTNYEGVRLIVVNYMASVIKNSKNKNQLNWCLQVLSCFSGQYNSSENVAPLYLSLADLYLN